MSVNDCKILKLPTICDRRGDLTFVEESIHIPFEIKRVYYVYNTPSNTTRGSHSHSRLEQLIIAAHGAFTVCLDDGCEKRSFRLASPEEGLYVCPKIWRTIEGYDERSVCLVLASLPFSEDDYCRDYKEFLGEQ